MEIEVLSEHFTTCYNLLSLYSQIIDSFSKAIFIIISLKIIGIIGDSLFGLQLILMMEEYGHPNIINYREIMLIIFLLIVPRILHCPIIIFGYGLFPTYNYRQIYLDKNDEFNHIFKALWYGSLFQSEEYLEKLYLSTFDIKIGCIYLIILIIDTCFIFYLCCIQSYVLPTNKKESILSAISHYLLIIWFVLSSFYGLWQNWYSWYKLTSKITFDHYINSNSNDINDISNIQKTFCEIWTFCICTIFLNGFSWLFLTFTCCAGFGFVIFFTIWLEWNNSNRQ